MSNPYVGECRSVGFSFAPVGWNFCDGSTQPISNFDALFTLIGTTYGGNGQTTFNLPDLRGRVPVHQGGGYVVGALSGVETVTLNSTQIPIHTHPNLGSSAPGRVNTVAGNLMASNSTPCYTNDSEVDTGMNAAMIGFAGSSQPHDNMQPFQAINWIISLYGVFPTQ
jgi:microcystin-dependent protein